ncbi:MAG: hypothetical protein R3C14_36435 [Caldilineaceae bacterium]
MIGSGTLVCGAGLLGLWFYFARRTLLQRWRQADSFAIVAPKLHYVSVLRGDAEIELAIHALQAGDTIIVRSGEIIPVDGIITSGTAWVENHHTAKGNHKEVKKVQHRVCANHLVLAGCISVLIELPKAKSTV